MVYKSFGRNCFTVFNYLVLIIVSVLCILPFIHLLAMSFSSSAAVDAGKVGLWPVDFTTASYEYALRGGSFFRAMGISILRVLIGATINVTLMLLTAYPLSKPREKLVGRNLYMAFFVFTMLIGGGMIPTYLVVSKTGLLNSIWALILPGALPVYNMVILMNFIRGIPEEMEEAAFIDGAGPMQNLLYVMLPVLKPGLATVGLFSIVGHWNAWFDGIIYLDNSASYPLQSYLHSILKSMDQLILEAANNYDLLLLQINGRTGRSSQLFMSALPIMLVYPLLQKYFTKGLVMGSVKG